MFVLHSSLVTQWLEGKVLLNDSDEIMAMVKGASW
jgi:hypothetical protein